MADDIKVSPTPIQRNINDVAIELTKLYYEQHAMEDETELQEMYAKFYSIANAMYINSGYVIKELLPEEIKDKLK